jgi:ABC-type sugar transport system ATPase subunit
MEAIGNGIGMITEDRHFTGVIPQSSVGYNILIANFPQYTNKAGIMDLRRMKEDAGAYVEKLRVKTPSVDTLMGNLSGGNQQKAIVARWLLTNSDILIVDEPTRGIDVGSKAEIHAIISELAKEGKAIIMISSEMQEVISVSDRVLVMHEGKMRAIIDRADVSQELIMKYCAGIDELEGNTRE